jgi:pimeloyl-ACP methyl ester carboxylesterase
MSEEFCRVGDVELCYETFGDRGDPAVLLVMGLGTQMIAWHDEFCERLAGRGFFVIRFDNRDCGRSTHVEGRPPTLAQLVKRDRRAAVYSLEDMAADGIGLLDHLGIERAHVAGASMGGMIAQTMAAGFPHRVRSLASIMSNTGALWSGQPAFRLYPVLLSRPPGDREAFIEHTVRTYGRIGSTGFERDDEDLRRIARLAYDRGHRASATGRQLAAILASGDRSANLRQIRVPTVVIHGTADRLVRPSGGRATARAIPGARLLLIDGMGHDLPRGAWPRIIGAIADNASRERGKGHEPGALRAA